MGNLDKTKVQERGITKLNFVCELMSFIAYELKYQIKSDRLYFKGSSHSKNKLVQTLLAEKLKTRESRS